MIGGIKHVVIHPGKDQEFLKLFGILKAEITKHEPGNVYYDLYRSRKDPLTYVVTERYRDEAAWKAHQNSAYGKTLFPQMRMKFAITTSATLRVFGAILFILCPIHSFSEQTTIDNLKPFRELVDHHEKYQIADLDRGITDLKSLQSDEIEKPYLLGMLYLIRAVAVSVKRGAKDHLKDADIQEDFRQSKANFDSVEAREPGYRYVYCKYAELYRYSLDEAGMRMLIHKLASNSSSVFVKECRAQIEDTGQLYASSGLLGEAKNIYAAIVNEWKPYPEYTLEALGDIEKALGHMDSAKEWWLRCVNEVQDRTRVQRCRDKLGSGSQS